MWSISISALKDSCSATAKRIEVAEGPNTSSITLVDIFKHGPPYMIIPSCCTERTKVTCDQHIEEHNSHKSKGLLRQLLQHKPKASTNNPNHVICCCHHTNGHIPSGPMPQQVALI